MTFIAHCHLTILALIHRPLLYYPTGNRYPGRPTGTKHPGIECVVPKVPGRTISSTLAPSSSALRTNARASAPNHQHVRIHDSYLRPACETTRPSRRGTNANASDCLRDLPFLCLFLPWFFSLALNNAVGVAGNLSLRFRVSEQDPVPWKEFACSILSTDAPFHANVFHT